MYYTGLFHSLSLGASGYDVRHSSGGSEHPQSAERLVDRYICFSSIIPIGIYCTSFVEYGKVWALGGFWPSRYCAFDYVVSALMWHIDASSGMYVARLHTNHPASLE